MDTDTTETGNTLNPRQKTWIVAAAGASVLIILVYLVYHFQQFHIVRTDPPAGSFATYASVLFVDYNKPLDNTGISVTSVPNIISSFDVSEKRLTLHLGSPVVAGSAYTITLKNVRSSSGDVIATDVLRFTGAYVPFDQLSTDMQAYITQNQDQAPPSRNTITYSGLDSLTDHGISSYQIDAMKQAIFLFGHNQGKMVKNVNLADNSIQVTPHDPNSASIYFSVSFALNIDGVTYNATLQYGDVTIVDLTLVSPTTKAVVYDSGYVDDSSIQT